jgi:AraC-like DNA-binding protein
MNPTVVALVIGRDARARILGALAPRFRVRFCDRCEEIWELCADPATVALITRPRDAAGECVAPCVARVHAGLPTVAVIAYVRWTETSGREVLELARAGVTDIVREGFDDTGHALRAAIADASIARAASEIRGEVLAVVPAETRSIFGWLLDHAQENLDVDALARALGVDRRTVTRRLHVAGLPTPRIAIGWCRLMLASRLLEDPGRTLEGIALALDFASGAALRNMLLRYTGLRPREVRENGGLRCVLHLFKRLVTAPSSAPWEHVG